MSNLAWRLCGLGLLIGFSACESRREGSDSHAAQDLSLPPLVWVHDVHAQDRVEAVFGMQELGRKLKREILLHEYSGENLEVLFQTVSERLKQADVRLSGMVHMTASGLVSDVLLSSLEDATRSSGESSVIWPDWLASITLHQCWSGVPPSEVELPSGLKSEGIVRPRHRPGVVLFEELCCDHQPGRLGKLALLLRDAAYRTQLVMLPPTDDKEYCLDDADGAAGPNPDWALRLWPDFLAGFDRHSQSLGADWIIHDERLTPAPALFEADRALIPRSDSTLEERLYNDVRSYFHLGEHRTGTKVDSATRAWVAERMRSLGFSVTQQDWHVLQFFPDDARVTNRYVSIDAWPLWTPASTPGQALSAPLAIVSALHEAEHARGSLALVDVLGSDRWRIPEYDRALIDAGAVGVIYVTGRGNTGYFYAENAPKESVNRVRELPGVVVGSRGRDQLLDRFRSDDHVELRIDGRLLPATGSSNVIATLDRGGPWIIVSTPTSGWFRAGGERGAGVALWFALGEWAASQDLPVSFKFVANSGHELDYYGAEQLFESGILPAPDQTLVWLHLGASIGTPAWQADGPFLRRDANFSSGNLLASEPFMTILERSFAAIDALKPQPHRAVGELSQVVSKGYPAFGLVGGGNVWSHSHPDTPESVSALSLAQVSRALNQTLASIVAEFETTPAK